ncbi:Crotonobetainyl-CoA:carnitine CoA-transferase CaiB [Rhizobiales bacterium GAS191]|jgi:crotonobetainyl-CoA:carnitine CoA-transferase CaiB-like acyl-CoA transferase|nr:Crotonobetainyl-CoA:carnitine CoA-transferase CaiB [Rhizobiales bacterium GAS113]SED59312.1 Crotonobetainyl-CoA:carnitine CoA-transferase CaiB [Rhizobiales bacterium GAS188]SEE88032.1 Crotonobetainyl-CoA:carnitine CoA-transferase CaiB [Rhizobiales bacterium GAS191]
MPLTGTKVLDLSRVLAGPWCAQTLADLGADVWKVEEPGRGDDTRAWMPPEIEGESTYYMSANRSKRSIAVDLKHPDGQRIVRELAMKADVLVENYKKGTLERFGLGYEQLSALNPRLVYCSISGYGRTGPRADEPGYDFAIQAESGLMSITGEPGGAPMKHGMAITDLVTGMNAAQAVLAALLARVRTGKGQLIDMALLDCAVALLANMASGHIVTGAEPQRLGNAHPTVVPYQVFETSDGDFVLAVGNDSQFRALCDKVVGLPDLSVDPRFATARGRVIHREALIPELAAAFRTRPTAEWIAALHREKVPCGQVRNLTQVFASPEIAARRMVAEVQDARHGTVKLMRSPLALRGTPTREPTSPPRLAEHTAALLSEVLGLDATAIAALRASGAVS